MDQGKPVSRRIVGLDFVRFLAAFGVFLYHFSCATRSEWFRQRFVNYANGIWGGTFVGLFLMLSGALLYRRYGDSIDVASFYRKRCRAIYPEFWLAFLAVYAKNAIEYRTPFFRGNPLLLILSFLGLDGYFLYRIPNYYLIGEWFLGAIVLLYLLFPLLRLAFRRAPALLTAALLLGCLVIDRTNFFRIGVDRNLIFCAFEFVLGMLLMKYAGQLRHAVFVCLAVEAALLWIRLPIQTNLYTALHAATLFILLWQLGALLEGRSRAFDAFIRHGAGLSYSVFLTHPVVLNYVLNHWNPGGLAGGFAALLVCTLATAAGAFALHFVAQRLLRILDRK